VGSGFRGFGVSGSVFGVYGSGFRVQDSGFTFQGSWFTFHQGSEFNFHGFEFGVWNPIRASSHSSSTVMCPATLLFQGVGFQVSCFRV